MCEIYKTVEIRVSLSAATSTLAHPEVCRRHNYSLITYSKTCRTVLCCDAMYPITLLFARNFN